MRWFVIYNKNMVPLALWSRDAHHDCAGGERCAFLGRTIYDVFQPRVVSRGGGEHFNIVKYESDLPIVRSIFLKEPLWYVAARDPSALRKIARYETVWLLITQMTGSGRDGSIIPLVHGSADLPTNEYDINSLPEKVIQIALLGERLFSHSGLRGHYTFFGSNHRFFDLFLGMLASSSEETVTRVAEEVYPLVAAGDLDSALCAVMAHLI